LFNLLSRTRKKSTELEVDRQSPYGTNFWLWPWRPDCRSWSFRAVALWTTYASLHHNRLIRSQRIIFASLATNERANGPIRNVRSVRQDSRLTEIKITSLFCASEVKTYSMKQNMTFAIWGFYYSCITLQHAVWSTALLDGAVQWTMSTDTWASSV